MSYIDKNKTFITNGNEYLDNILSMMESTAILSDTFKTRIFNLTVWILTNHSNHIDEINNEINTLISEMKWLNIFSKKFVNEIFYLLVRGLEFEKNK